jgi:hypothetical protein
LLYFMSIGYIIMTFGILNVHVVYFVVIRCKFFPVLVYCAKKNLATLLNRKARDFIGALHSPFALPTG